MKRINLSTTINAPKQYIWKAIVDPHFYKIWTKVFMSTSYYEGGWKKGDTIRFLAIGKEGKKEGMISEIAESDFPNYISIKHLGYIWDGVDDTTSDAITSWAPAYENYSLKTISVNQTLFEVDMDVEDSHYEMMLIQWPQAMEEIKKIAENLDNQRIYPCLWFNKEAREAVEYYSGIFSNFIALKQNEFVSTFEINGCKFMAINGGPHYKMNPAVSYFVYCGGDQEIDRLYKALIHGGDIIMPLDKYAWSPRYACIIDKFGVSWHLDVEEINNSQKIVPTLLFVNEKNLMVGDAVEFYSTIFENSKILLKAPYPPNTGMPDDAILFAQYKLLNVVINSMSSTMHHDYDFTPGNSLVIECSHQDEIDYYWEKLGEGGKYSRCGWLTDKFGLSWQIIPDFLTELTTDPIKGPKVVEAFMQMTKFEIEPLLKAAE
jgi:predicted 3-demethylubiquinone-9 3-methyltransferase (glyoxalase superfamily)